jgi:hypothetical protein
MSDIYCGAKETIPKGKKRGSMKQCVEKKQISYFGIKKIDSKMIELLNGKNKTTKKESPMKTLLKLAGQRGTLTARISKLKKAIAAEKDSKKQKELEKQLKETNKQLTETIKLYNEAKQNISRQTSRSLSRMSSNLTKYMRGSARKSSRKSSRK